MIEEEIGEEINNEIKEVTSGIGQVEGEIKNEIEEITKNAPKENNLLLIGVVVMGIAVIGMICAMAYMYFVSGRESEISLVKKTDTKAISDQPIFTVWNWPKIDGSTATQPLMKVMVNEFLSEMDARAVMDISRWTKTHEAYERLINREVDLIIVTEPSAEELALASASGIMLDVEKVVNEGFVFMVSEENPVDNLSIGQIRDIYSGRVKNWQEVGGENSEIIAYQRQVNSGSQTGMLSLVMREEKMQEPITEDLMIHSMSAIVDRVVNYENSAGAMGYSYYYYATTMFDEIDTATANKVKLLAVDGVAPNEETIKNGSYPLRSGYYIVTRAGEADESALKLKEIMLGDQGQEVVRKAKYVGIK